MREYKFRAWDKRFKRMVYDSPMAILFLNDSDHELMEYTGLHDKNGKEIYEGDILLPDKELSLTLYTHPKHLVEVVYECGFFGVRDLGTRHGRIDGGMMVNPDDWLDTEVIGNIYENKELLND